VLRTGIGFSRKNLEILWKGILGREREREQAREMGETGRDEGKWMRKWMNDEGKAN
jgi:hypothetical protein